jgi:hypothetical protein
LGRPAISLDLDDGENPPRLVGRNAEEELWSEFRH